MSVKAAKNFLEGFGHLVCSSASPEDGKEPNIGKEFFFGFNVLWNETKWPRQIRELILASDPEILECWSLDKERMEED